MTSKFQVGDTVRLDFVVTKLNDMTINIRRFHLNQLHKSTWIPLDTVIYTDDPTVEHVPKPRTVEVGQKYKCSRNLGTTYEVLFVYGDTSFVKWFNKDRSECISVRNSELLSQFYTLIE